VERRANFTMRCVTPLKRQNNVTRKQIKRLPPKRVNGFCTDEILVAHCRHQPCRLFLQMVREVKLKLKKEYADSQSEKVG